MKKYNKPEIVALALETVDVIETSGETQALNYATQKFTEANVQAISNRIANMDNTWSW